MYKPEKDIRVIDLKEVCRERYDKIEVWPDHPDGQVPLNPPEIGEPPTLLNRIRRSLNTSEPIFNRLIPLGLLVSGTVFIGGMMGSLAGAISGSNELTHVSKYVMGCAVIGGGSLLVFGSLSSLNIRG